MSPKVDFSHVSDVKPVPAGKYRATLTKFRYKAESNASKQPCEILTYTIQDEEYQGRLIWKTYSLQPQALFSIKRDMIALGVDEDAFEDPEMDLEVVLAELIGAECGIVVSVGPIFKGSDRIGNSVEQVININDFLFGGN